MKRFLAAIFAVLMGLAGLLVSRASPAPTETPPPLILISLDGFRWDYCAKYPDETPHLRRLIATGVSAERMIPVFPSNTFPNHYSIVTGLYPANHGMINNDMVDAATGEVFHYKNPRNARASQWWGGQPIWTTAVLQGRKSACYFWVGSEAENHGVHATHWKPFNYSIPFTERLETVVSWLRLPAPERPAFIAFYLEETNSVGHTYGPDSPELAAAVRQLDDHLGTMLGRLEAEGIAANIIVVSDHGMTEVSVDRVVILEDHISLDEVQVDFSGSVVGLRPLNGDVPALIARLSDLPHARVYRVEDLPAHLHLRTTSRTPEVWILPDEGWHVGRRAEFEKLRDRYLRGDHGYDPALLSMGATFIAQGPSFRSGVQLAPVENIHVYNLMCAALGLDPAPNDGDDRLVRAVLRD